MKAGTVVPAFLDAGQWSASFGVSWSELLLADFNNEARFFKAGTYLREMAGTGGIADGRNRLAEAFLNHTEAEWLWMVDTDMGFAPDVVERLLASADKYQRPVVGALCFALRRREKERADLRAERFGIVPTVYQWRTLDDEAGFQPVRQYPRNELVRADGTGAACMLIHRRVLERLHKDQPYSWFTPITVPGALKGRPRTFSEDLSFCVRLKAADIPLHIHTGIQTSHEKGGIFLTEEEFDRQQAAEPVATEATSAA